MIEYIKGNLADLTPTYAVLEAAGVGYAINIALPSYSALVGKENTETKLFVTEIIREDTHDLYGFFTRGERELFLMLINRRFRYVKLWELILRQSTWSG